MFQAVLTVRQTRKPLFLNLAMQRWRYALPVTSLNYRGLETGRRWRGTNVPHETGQCQKTICLRIGSELATGLCPRNRSFNVARQLPKRLHLKC